MTIQKRLFQIDRLFISDIDNTLIGHSLSLRTLVERLEKARDYVGFGVATGRNIDLALDVLQAWDVPMPDIFITSVGVEINYWPDLVEDREWKNYLNVDWDRDAVVEAMKYIPGLRLQSREGQRRHKVSYLIDTDRSPEVDEIREHLRKLRFKVNVIFSHQEFLDILPAGASKGKAIEFISNKWNIPLERILVAGDSGNDEEMLVLENTPAVAVGNHCPELARVRGTPGVYFAKGHYASGILEAMDYYEFFG